MNRILAELGTPARLSQVRGNSPGRLPGAKIKKATRYPTVFKSKIDNEKVRQIV